MKKMDSMNIHNVVKVEEEIIEYKETTRPFFSKTITATNEKGEKIQFNFFSEVREDLVTNHLIDKE